MSAYGNWSLHHLFGKTIVHRRPRNPVRVIRSLTRWTIRSCALSKAEPYVEPNQDVTRRRIFLITQRSFILSLSLHFSLAFSPPSERSSGQRVIIIITAFQLHRQRSSGGHVVSNGERVRLVLSLLLSRWCRLRLFLWMSDPCACFRSELSSVSAHSIRFPV